jgi:hypothetical protein
MPIKRTKRNKQEQPARNRQIVRDREKGMSWHDIGDKHGISFARARAICLMMMKRTEAVKGLL